MEGLQPSPAWLEGSLQCNKEHYSRWICPRGSFQLQLVALFGAIKTLVSEVIDLYWKCIRETVGVSRMHLEKMGLALSQENSCCSAIFLSTLVRSAGKCAVMWKAEHEILGLYKRAAPKLYWFMPLWDVAQDLSLGWAQYRQWVQTSEDAAGYCAVAVHKALPSYFHMWKMFLHPSILNSKSDFLNCICSSGMRIISFVKEIMKQSHKATNISCMWLNIILIYWSFWYLYSKIVTWIHQLSCKHSVYIQSRGG